MCEEKFISSNDLDSLPSTKSSSSRTLSGTVNVTPPDAREWSLLLLNLYCRHIDRMVLNSKHVIGSPTLDVDLSPWPDAQRCWSLEALKRHKNAWQSLTARACSLTDRDFISSVVGPSLTKLDIAGSALLGDASAKIVGQQCRQLVNLNLSGCGMITDKGMAVLARGCLELETVRLERCPSITDESVSELLTNCKKLLTLSLCGSENICGSGFLTLPSACQSVLLIVHDKLSKIDLSHCPRVTDEAVRWLSESLPRLERVSLSHCHRLNDIAVKHLDIFHSQLRQLDISYCPKLGNQALKALTNFNRLESICVSGLSQVTPRCFESLIAGLPLLKEFECGESRFRALPPKSHAFRPASILETLRIPSNVGLGHSFFQNVGQFFHLVELNLAGNSGFQATDLALVTHTCYQTLESLDISYCTDVCSFEPWAGGPLLELDCFRGGGSRGSSSAEDSSVISANVAWFSAERAPGFHARVGSSCDMSRRKDIHGHETFFATPEMTFSPVPTSFSLRLKAIGLSGLPFVSDENLCTVVSPIHTRRLAICDNPRVMGLGPCCAKLNFLSAQDCPRLDSRLVQANCPELKARMIPKAALFRARLDAEEKSARIIQKRFRSFIKTPWLTLPYILIKFRNITPPAAVKIQSRWREYRVPHYRELLRRLIVVQRAWRRTLLVRKLRKHLAELRRVWASTVTLQRAYRGYRWRRINADLVQFLHNQRWRRIFTRIADECAVVASCRGVLHRALIESYWCEPELGRKAPVRELGLVLAPARTIIALKSRCMVELEQAVAQREARMKRELEEAWAMRKALFGVNAIRIQRRMRGIIHAKMRARQGREREMADTAPISLDINGQAMHLSISASRSLAKTQARWRGHLLRQKPEVLIKSDLKVVRELFRELKKLFVSQQTVLDDGNSFARRLDYIGVMRKRYEHADSSIEAVKKDYYGSMETSVSLRATISRLFHRNYIKRQHYHDEASAALEEEVGRLQALREACAKIDTNLATRLEELERGEHGYESSADPRVRKIALRASTSDNKSKSGGGDEIPATSEPSPARSDEEQEANKARFEKEQIDADECAQARKWIKEIVAVETKWAHDNRKRIELVLREASQILGKVARLEAQRLRRELVLQEEIFSLFNQVSEATKREWAYRDELLSTQLDKIQAAADPERQLQLTNSEERLRNCIAELHAYSKERSERYIKTCLHTRDAFWVSKSGTKTKLERCARAIHKELKGLAWTASVSAAYLKPPELVALQQEIMQARKRLVNKELLDDLVKTKLGEEDESHFEGTQLKEVLKELRQDSERTSQPEDNVLQQLLVDAAETKKRSGASSSGFDKNAGRRLVAKAAAAPVAAGKALIDTVLGTEAKKERIRIARTILEHQKAAIGSAVAISHIAITVGRLEEERMTQKAAYDRSEGRPFFSKIRCDLARAFEIPDSVYFWIKGSSDPSEHIRGISLETDYAPQGETLASGQQIWANSIEEKGNEEDGEADNDDDDDEDDEEDDYTTSNSDDSDYDSGTEANRIAKRAAERERKHKERIKAEKVAKRRELLETHGAKGMASIQRAGACAARLAARFAPKKTLDDEVTHPRLPNLRLSFDRDGLAEGSISEIKITCNSFEEGTLGRKNYTKMPIELCPMEPTHVVRDHFHMWVLREDGKSKQGGRKVLNIDTLRKQKQEFEELLRENPDNDRVRQLLAEVEMDIADFSFSHEEKDAASRLAEKVELLALTKKDMGRLMSCFAAMDTEQSGSVTVDQFFYYIGVKLNTITRQVFQFLDSSGDGSLDFRELLDALATFCLFGVREVVQVLFNIADVQGRGVLPKGGMENLLRDLHGIDVSDHRDLKRAYAFVDDNYFSGLGLEDVLEVQRRYPLCFEPVFTIQKSMMKAFLGVNWWEKKKALFARARAELKRANDKELARLRRAQLKAVRGPNKYEQFIDGISGVATSAATSATNAARPALGKFVDKMIEY